MKSLAEKMLIKQEDHILVMHAPSDWYDESMRHADRHPKEGQLYEHVMFFTRTQQELALYFPALKRHITHHGKIWVVWPKARKLNSKLSLDRVVKTVYPLGMVENINVAVDETWTALKFTWPVPGKIYRNHHAQLIIDPEHEV